jgi:hypothetical protein
MSTQKCKGTIYKINNQSYCVGEKNISRKSKKSKKSKNKSKRSRVILKLK